MIEVLNGNFKRVLPEVLDAITSATFIAIDTEFGASFLAEVDRPSLFDAAATRYAKLRSTVGRTLPLQVGVAIFKFEANANAYKSTTYTFYVCPKPIASINHNWQFQAESVHFLSQHAFDFNKLFYTGVSFLNSPQERQLRDDLARGWTAKDANEHLANVLQTIKDWQKTDTESITIKKLSEQLQNHPGIIYTLQKQLRDEFLWTELDDSGNLTCRKVAQNVFKTMNLQHNIIDDTLNDVLGFTHVYRKLAMSKKPIIGHNMIMDLMLLESAFGDELPRYYRDFKKRIHEKFPKLYDTKSISFGVSKLIDKDVVWKHSQLSGLYYFFKDGAGRHLAFNSPKINEMSDDGTEIGNFHNAGWDAHCTGYIFIRMAHYLAAKDKGQILRDIMSVEHFAHVSQWMNHVNLIRASISHLVLDGDDPVSTRPPMLVAIARPGTPSLDMSEVLKSLSMHGYVELQVINKRRALIAISNKNDAKQIMSNCNNSQFILRKYNILLHGPYATHFMLGLTVGLSCVLMFGVIRAQ